MVFSGHTQLWCCPLASRASSVMPTVADKSTLVGGLPNNHPFPSDHMCRDRMVTPVDRLVITYLKLETRHMAILCVTYWLVVVLCDTYWWVSSKEIHSTFSTLWSFSEDISRLACEGSYGLCLGVKILTEVLHWCLLCYVPYWIILDCNI